MDFTTFFGIDAKNIKKNCIICQNFDISLFSNKVLNGLFIKSININDITVIALKNNFLAGDTILHLKDSPCENIFVFGSCGGCGKVTYGDLVVIDKAYNLESFSSMLNFKDQVDYYQSSTSLLDRFYKKNMRKKFIKTNSACVSSLYLESRFLESRFLDWFKENEILVVDMESSIILSASSNIGRKAICLMYVSDIIGQDSAPFLQEQHIKQRVALSRKTLAETILRFCNEQ
jgi:purine-nucleoside phosphorylase